MKAHTLNSRLLIIMGFICLMGSCMPAYAAVPVANTQNLMLNEDTAMDIILNATDTDGHPLTYSIVTKPRHGSLTGAAPTLRYAPSADYNGPDSFTFKANDGTSDSNTATVALTLLPISDPPAIILTDLVFSIDLNTPITKSFPLAVDPDRDLLTATMSPPLHGATFDARGVFSWAPTADDIGQHAITFTVADAEFQASGTVNVIVREARKFYVDPLSGDMANNGSDTHPWRTLQEVFANNLIEFQVQKTYPYRAGTMLKRVNTNAPVKSGDTILLRSGYHGEIWWRGAFNTDYITIAAEEGHTPLLRRIFLSAVSKWILRGLTISPETAPQYTNPGTLLFIESHGWHGLSYDVMIENNTLYSVQDTSQWTADDWNTLSATGIGSQAPYTIIRNNHLKNVNFGITMTGDYTLNDHNTVENIAGDGMVGCADNITIQYNTIKSFYRVNDNHSDGIQFHRGINLDKIPMKNAILRGNTIISKEAGETNPLVGSPQGIGCFDPLYTDWIVENNIVLVQHYHGISLYGCENCKVMNNLSFDPLGTWPAWISLGNGGKNTVARNNIARSYNLSGINITADHNIDLARLNPADYFTDYPNYDFHLKSTSPAIDAGNNEFAPSIDIAGTPRPQGTAPDVGPYEYVSMIYGDVSNDGEVTGYDAALVAQVSVGLIPLTADQTRAADVSGDGEVTAYDAALIAQKAVGLIDKFPVEHDQ